jgi:hypothetical protein
MDMIPTPASRFVRHVAAAALCGAISPSSGHEREVHDQITRHAEASAFTLSTSYSAFLATISSDCTRPVAVDSMAEGSIREDDNVWRGDGGFRSFNHFYDPTTRLGLSDFPVDYRISPFGVDSFTWASTRNCPGINFRVAGLPANVNTYNRCSWQNARDGQWLGLTAQQPAYRFVALTNMFRAIGQVIHLLQDKSQPQHTRNEQHLFFLGESPIEGYGREQLPQLNFQHAMLPWRADEFTSLEDFWNRGAYVGLNSTWLVADAAANGASSARLGLAEFSNGNFLGARHLFPEYYSPGKVQYYPFPSRNRSTTYNQVRANPSTGLDTFTMDNGHQGRGIYLRKNADGVVVPHLARVNYLGARIPNLTGVPYCTIDDPLVLQDYHNVLIPKAVEYSAGAIDYFFRGRLDASLCAPSPDDESQRSLLVTNLSGATLNHGQFVLLWDTAGHVRTPVASFPVTTLANNETATFQFTMPQGPVANYVVAYHGSIDVAGPNYRDPVDADIAAAATLLNDWLIDEFDPPDSDCSQYDWDFMDLFDPVRGHATVHLVNRRRLASARADFEQRWGTHGHAPQGHYTASLQIRSQGTGCRWQNLLPGPLDQDRSAGLRG